MKRVSRAVLPAGGTVLLLFLVSRHVSAAEVWSQIATLQPVWLLLAALLAPIQVALLGYRWHLVASRLGAHVRRREALIAYGLSNAVNQVVPGGFGGDALRVVHHARAVGGGPAVRAAVLERVIGVGTSLGLAGAALLVWWLAGVSPPPPTALWVVVGFTLFFGAMAHPRASCFGPLGRDLRTCLGSADWPTLAAASLALTLSFVLGFVFSSLAVGASPSVLSVLAMALIVLTLSIPISVGGWGLRELSALALLGAAGLGADTAVAVGATYGLSAFLGALPVALGALWVQHQGHRQATP